MDFWTIIIAVIFFAGMGFFIYKTYIEKDEIEDKPVKPEPAVTTHAKMRLKTAELEQKGIRYKLNIIPINIFERDYKTPEKLKEMFHNMFTGGLGGSLYPSPEQILLNYTGKDLYETTYTVTYKNGKTENLQLLLLVADAKEEPVPTPDPVPEPPKFETIFFHLPQDGSDVTAVFQEQWDKLPNDSEIMRHIFLPEGRFWSEGLAYMEDWRDRTHVTMIADKKNVIVFAYNTTFFTKAPAVNHGGDVSTSWYSYRRHLKVWDCENFTIKGLRIEGSDTIWGKLIGSSRELTPDFWWNPYNKSENTYVPNWYLYERAANLTEDIPASEIEELSSADYIKLLKSLLPDGELVPGPNDDEAWSGYPAYREYLEKEHGIEIGGGKNVTLEDCYVYAVWGDGFYIGYSDSKRLTGENITLKNCTAHFVGRQGTCLGNNCINVELINFKTIRVRRSHIDCEPHSIDGYVRNVRILGGESDAQLTFIAAMGNGDVSDIYVDGPRFSSGATTVKCGDSRKLTMRRNWTLKNGVRTNGYNSPHGPIQFRMTENILIENWDDFVEGQGLKAFSFWHCKGPIKIKNSNFHNALYGEIITKSTEQPVDIEWVDNTPEKVDIKYHVLDKY